MVNDIACVYRNHYNYNLKHDYCNKLNEHYSFKSVKYNLQIHESIKMEGYQRVATTSIKSSLSLPSNLSMYKMSDRT